MGEARVVLVQAPVFSRLAPCNGIALLTAHLKAAGVPVRVHDASLSLRRALSSRKVRWPDYLLSDGEQLLAAVKKELPGFLPRFLDEQAQAIARLAPDIVGFSVQYSSEECSLGLAERLKALRPSAAVVLGGPQCAREIKALQLIREPAVDAVALGEADASFAEFSRAFRPGAGLPRVPGFLLKESGRVVDLGDAPEFADLDALPFMDFSGFDMEAYQPDTLFMVASRGCVRKCAFCTDIVHRKTYRRMSAERIVAEIRHQMAHYPDRYFVRFDDSLVNGDVRLVARLSELLAPLRIELLARRSGRDFGWGGMAIIHPTMTPSLLRTMRRGGCQSLAYGLESGSQKVLDLMRKGFRVPDAERVLRDTREAGIRIQLFVMAGFPGETDEDFRQTLGFLERNAEFIDMVDTSLCAIAKGSHLDVHREDYGVVVDPADPYLWRSADGANTYAVRRARFREVKDACSRLGFREWEGSHKIMERDSRSPLRKPAVEAAA